MSSDESRVRVLVPFVKHTLVSLKSMAGVAARPGKPYRDDPDCFWLNDYAVAVDTSGAVQGTILIHFYFETALSIGKKVHEHMLGPISEPLDVDNQIIEALMEFGNTAVGLATQDLAAMELPIVFESPYFVSEQGEMERLMEGVQEVLTVPIKMADGSMFFFNYLVRQATEV